ncbi:hypothetical protein DPSP01_007583 [Paraphaeosphaeria sporulosa]
MVTVCAQAGNVLQAEPDESSKDSLRTLSQLYVLAENLMDVHAKNHVVEAIYDRVETSVVPMKHDICDGLADRRTVHSLSQ